MTAYVAEAEPLKSLLAAVLAIAMFNTLIFRATPAATGFAVVGMDQVIAGMLCTTRAMPLVLAIALVGLLPSPSDVRCGNDPFWRQRR